MLKVDPLSSGHLVPSQLGLIYASLLDSNTFSKPFVKQYFSQAFFVNFQTLHFEHPMVFSRFYLYLRK